MNLARNFKTVVAGVAVAGVLAFSPAAQAIPYSPHQAFGAGYGDAANPAVLTASRTGAFFQDTVNFDLGSFTHFNMTSTENNLTNWFGASLFENVNDAQVTGGAAATSFTSFALPDLGIPIGPGAGESGDYHLHPAGIGGPGGSYTITMWGTNGPGGGGGPAPVPVPAALWLFGSGLAGVVSFARRKMA